MGVSVLRACVDAVPACLRAARAWHCRSNCQAPYEAGRSPDKGAVLAYFPGARLLVAGAHLAGTNTHGVAEDVFDALRREQLREVCVTPPRG